MKKFFAIILTALMLTSVLTITDNPLVETKNVYASVKMNKKSVSITKGKKVQLKVLGTKKKAKWSSSAKSVATVNSKGLVTGKKKGTAKITAKIGKKKYACKVTVKDTVTYYFASHMKGKDKYKEGMVRKIVLKDNEIITYGSFRKASSEKKLWNGKSTYCKDQKRTFKLDKNVKFYAAGGESPDERLSRNEVQEYCKYANGLGFELKVVNGKVTKVVFSS